MPISNYDKCNVGNILAGEGHWFTANLLRVIATADSNNRAKLYKVFPEEVDTVCVFQTGKAFECKECLESVSSDEDLCKEE